VRKVLGDVYAGECHLVPVWMIELIPSLEVPLLQSCGLCSMLLEPRLRAEPVMDPLACDSWGEHEYIPDCMICTICEAIVTSELEKMRDRVNDVTVSHISPPSATGLATRPHFCKRPICRPLSPRPQKPRPPS